MHNDSDAAAFLPYGAGSLKTLPRGSETRKTDSSSALYGLSAISTLRVTGEPHMMSKVHFWIVCDAVDYIKEFGDEQQKAALQTFQLAYGEKKSIDEIPVAETAIEYLAGFESWQTDKFKDLSLRMRVLPGVVKQEVTGLGWHHFTAFNHFINPFPEEESGWPNGNGYSYPTSSMTGCDSVVVQGISRCLHGVVDAETSLVLDRIKPYWKLGEADWADNLERGLSATKFAPWSVLVQVYYAHLLLNHYEPLEVRGANRHIVGIQLLGPVLHAVADACSPQHVRSALGFGHSIWENYVKARVYHGDIGLDAGLVRRLLEEEPFALDLRVQNGSLKGAFDIEDFLRRLSVLTANRLMGSTSKNWKDLWQTEGQFWKRYLRGATMRGDAHQFYNMAVAGTIRMLTRSCADLVARGVLGWGQGFGQRRALPELELAQKDLAHLPLKQNGTNDPPSEEVMPVPYSHARDILGFDPIGATRLGDLLNQVLRTDVRRWGDRSYRETRSHLLKEIELEVTDQYLKAADRAGAEFSPFELMESIPVESDLSAHWGAATYRMPSAQECDDPELFLGYMDLNDSHAYIASTLQLTQTMSALRYYGIRFSHQSAVASRLAFVGSEVARFRDEELGEFLGDFGPTPVWSMDRQERSLGDVQAEDSTSVKQTLSVAWEKITSLFTLMPKMALATVAAAMLLLIIILPRGDGPEPLLGLSSEQWKPHKLRLMGTPKPVPKSVYAKKAPEKERPVLAILIYFRNFPHPIDQKTIDEAYRAIRPTPALEKRYHVVRPGEVKTAVEREGIDTRTPLGAARGLRAALKVKEALIVTISSHAELIDIQCRLTDADTGEVIRVKTRSKVPEKELTSVLRSSILELLAS